MITKLELRRKLMHIFIGLLTVILLLMFGWPIAIFLLVGSALFIIVAKRRKMTLVNYIIDKFERQENKGKKPGMALFTLIFGISLAYAVFSVKTDMTNVALAAAMVSILGDSFSTIGGKLFGKTRIYGNKTLEGSFSGLIFAFIGALVFLPFYDALFIAVFGMLLELLCPPRWDDNILVPFGSGLVLFIKSMI